MIEAPGPLKLIELILHKYSLSTRGWSCRITNSLLVLLMRCACEGVLVRYCCKRELLSEHELPQIKKNCQQVGLARACLAAAETGQELF